MRRASALVALVAAALYTVTYRLERPGGIPAYDVYSYFYPNVLYALDRLRVGGGLLWNPLQDCGQPFFATSSVGLLYPGNVFFLLLDPPVALRALLFTNLLVGGAGMWALAREIGLGRAGAAGAALAFVLGGTTFGLTTWMPTVQGPFVWMPVALLLCERLVKTGDLRHAVWLGIVFALALLPGHPQFALFSGQLVALRLLWSLGDRSERRHVVRAVAGVSGAAVLMLLLAAIQYLPAQEVAAQSVRSGTLRAAELSFGATTSETLRLALRTNSVLTPLAMVPGFVVAAALADRRRAALFYLLAGLLFLVLAFGDATPLGWLYARTPLGGMFRMPGRFVFASGFCVSVLIGIAIDVLGRGSRAGVVLAGAALAACSAWVGELTPTQQSLAAVVLAGGTLSALRPERRSLATALVLGGVVLAFVLIPSLTLHRYFSDDRPLRVHADAFDGLRTRLTPQDRVHLVRPERDPAFNDKTASLFGLRATTDLEPQLTRAYAEYLTMLRSGQPMRSLKQVYYLPPWDLRMVRWPLIHLAAARYLAVAPGVELPSDTAPFLVPLRSDAGVRTYENAAALPRAYYVPQVAVEPDGEARLRRLAQGVEDRRRVALVEAVPPSEFTGVAGNDAAAAATFVVDEPERVVVELTAPARGFLFLADQYFPGWSASVNGEAAPILRANHAFRLVEVPAGAVRVGFRYRPLRVWLGAVVSTVTLLGVAGALAWTRRSGRSG